MKLEIYLKYSGEQNGKYYILKLVAMNFLNLNFFKVFNFSFFY